MLSCGFLYRDSLEVGGERITGEMSRFACCFETSCTVGVSKIEKKRYNLWIVERNADIVYYFRNLKKTEAWQKFTN